MFRPDQYELLDFGNGRKLERFGRYVLDRPAPAAEGKRSQRPRDWSAADARYERTGKDRGHWSPAGFASKRWTVEHERLRFALKPTDFGHLGLFVEQAANWDWMQRQVKRLQQPAKVLNLFAYTGGSTLAAAAAGAEVVHVDAARNVVAWARRNAELSQLSHAPIRWITDDASQFVQREVRRGNRYDAVILDPPSYGHGTKGQVWKLATQLMPLLRACRELTQPRPIFLLLTCHTPGFGAAELSACLSDTFFGSCQTGVLAKALSIRTEDGRRLPAGFVARWP